MPVRSPIDDREVVRPMIWIRRRRSNERNRDDRAWDRDIDDTTVSILGGDRSEDV